jgi:hypothetical protein
MADPVNLHQVKNEFNSLIKETADLLGIRDVFVEKDYWITLVLKRLADSEYSNLVVFKGGTSLSKGYKLINRFSEDVDIAIINDSTMVGNQLKNLIRNVEKTISRDLSEIDVQGITSKGSKFRKSVFYYPIIGDNNLNQNVSSKLLIETNSFANPHPYVNLEIRSMICEFLEYSHRSDLIKTYGLEPFTLNILDKRRTFIEKIVSLIRFSFSENSITGISEKIRHFYDIYYLLNDTECKTYFDSESFIKDITDIIIHDRTDFDEPPGWGQKAISQSPLITDFDSLWNNVKATYIRELSNLAFSEIPNDKDVADTFKQVINKLRSITI